MLRQAVTWEVHGRAPSRCLFTGKAEGRSEKELTLPSSGSLPRVAGQSGLGTPKTMSLGGQGPEHLVPSLLLSQTTSTGGLVEAGLT